MDRADETWRDGAEIPAIEKGTMREFIVAVYRARTGKNYSFSATYLNGYGLTYNDGCPQGKTVNICCEGCEDGCPTTGWFSEEGNDDGDSTTFQGLHLAEGDKLIAWRNVPQFSGVIG